MSKLNKKILETGLKQGTMFGIKLSSSKLFEVLKNVDSSLDEKQKIYILINTAESVLMATTDWLLRKTILRSTYAIPEGVQISKAFNYLYNLDIGTIDRHDLFWEIIKILDKKGLRACLVGNFGIDVKNIVENINTNYKNIVFRTYDAPNYNMRSQLDNKLDRKAHKSLLGKIKIFEPDFVFVALGTPKQEKWIYRNFFRLKATGAMAMGDILLPKWQREINKNIKFPLKVLLSKR